MEMKFNLYRFSKEYEKRDEMHKKLKECRSWIKPR